MTADTSPSPPGARGDDRTPQTTIVAGVDGSVSAEHAASWAAGEAERRDATLMLVHALHLPAPSALRVQTDVYAEQRRLEGRKLLHQQAETVRTAHPRVQVTAELSDLDPARTLVESGESAALVVTGSRGRGGFTGMLLGSVSRKLAVHTRCPLVVVRDEPPGDAADRIVLGLGRKHSDAAVRYAFEAARRQDAVLDVVHAYFASVLYTGMAGASTMLEGHPESDRLYALKDAQSAIEPYAAEYSDVTVNVAALEGNAVAALIDAARNARLLVVATHRRRGPLRVGSGYVVDGVLAHSPVPVAVIPDR
jgi:nucleotide-binding universal stress UspA family protein